MAVKSDGLVFRSHKVPRTQNESHQGGGGQSISAATSGMKMENSVSSDQKSNPGDSRNSSMAEEYRLLDWDELPDWQRDNEYILTSYRQASGSYRISIASACRIHNETVNIFSHLFGSILFFTLPIYVYSNLYPRYQSATAADIVVFSTFFFGVAICFFLSSTFHIFNNHSPRVAAFGNQLDYLGIVILMVGSTIPSVYYGFYCDHKLQMVYWSVVVALGFLCVIVTLNPKFRHPTLRPWRSAMYSGLGLSAIFFMSHGLIKYGWETQKMRMSIDWMLIMAAFNLTGAAAYAIRIPERWYPRRYDIVGSSHQILHFMVIFAGLAHYFGLVRAFDHVHGQTGICTVV